MKRNFLKIMAVAGVLVGGSLSASAAEHLKVNVPFSFVLAGLEFQPGEYTVDENNSGVLTLSGEGRGAMVITIPAEMGKSTASSAVEFVTDGHQYHLIGLQKDGEGSRAVSSSAYREHRLTITAR